MAEHHAEAPRLIGSVARGDDEPGSDVDLLVDFTGTTSLLDEIGPRIAREDLLGVPVDVLAADTQGEPLREGVVAEAVEV